MASPPLDALDRGILYHLQQDARQPLADVAAALDVPVETVRDRTGRLEAEGVIQRYTVDVDYSRADVEHQYLFICSTRVRDREAAVREVRGIPGVIRVTSVMTGSHNVFVRTVAETKEGITDIAYQIDRAGVRIEREHLVWDDLAEPYAGLRADEPS